MMPEKWIGFRKRSGSGNVARCHTGRALENLLLLLVESYMDSGTRSAGFSNCAHMGQLGLAIPRSLVFSVLGTAGEAIVTVSCLD